MLNSEPTFATNYQDILKRIDQIDPKKYAGTRNFIDGAVTYLSPYISRGVISTKQVYDAVIAKGFEPNQIEKFIQELAWRDYWQQIWIAKGDAINEDLIKPQPNAERKGIAASLNKAETGIDAIDQGIKTLYQTGYMHNHIRMYVASIACNVAKCHWQLPAKWMYYHLFDGDWASNALSWQWVCGANSHKLYYANQENINKYCHTAQSDTFLDVPYERFNDLPIPAALEQTEQLNLSTPLPKTDIPKIKKDQPTLIYNYYNLDPNWHKDLDANRILLLEPSVFEQYPIAEKVLNFCIELAKANLPNIQIYVAEFTALEQLAGEIIFKEHPLNNYNGKQEPRTWLTSVTGYLPSFFRFYKKARKELIPK
jgi:deoxyribodipyrimidine photo-lyase